MELLCSPSCFVTLTSIGSAQVSTAFDMCKTPPNLEIKIKTAIQENAVSSTFTAGNILETRQIGNNDFPLELNVKFKEQTLWNNRRSYRAKAYIWMPDTGEKSYFMNGSIEVPPNGYCKYHHTSSSAQILLLCTLLTLFFVGTSIAVSMLIHCIYARQLNMKSRNHKSKVFVKKAIDSDAVQVIPSFSHSKLSRGTADDERLPVILEIEEDELDKGSEYGLSEAAAESEPFKKALCAQLATSIPQLAVSCVNQSEIMPKNSKSVQDLKSLNRSFNQTSTQPVEV